MRIDRRFPLQVGAALLVMALVAAYPLLRYGTEAVIFAVLAGTALSTVNVLAGFLTIEYSFDRSYTTFLKAVLGGMGIRMALMLGALLVCILGFRLHTLAVTIGMMVPYSVFLVLEILFLQKKVQVKHQG
jgi:hypothetical protein